MVGVGRLLAAMARRSARRGSWRVGSEAAMVVMRGIELTLIWREGLQQLWRAGRSWEVQSRLGFAVFGGEDQDGT